jgi:hypothetical protein
LVRNDLLTQGYGADNAKSSTLRPIDQSGMLRSQVA